MSSKTAVLEIKYPETLSSAFSRTAKNCPLATASEGLPDFSAIRSGTVDNQDH